MLREESTLRLVPQGIVLPSGPTVVSNHGIAQSMHVHSTDRIMIGDQGLERCCQYLQVFRRKGVHSKDAPRHASA